jgi:putative flippase GtrA
LTFKEKIRESIFRKYTKFITISIIALVVNLIFLYWFVEYFKIWYVFAQVLAIGASLLINFFGNKIWTFRER